MARYTKAEIIAMLSDTNPKYIEAFLEQYISTYMVPFVKDLVGRTDKNFIAVQTALQGISGAGALGHVLRVTDTTIDPTARPDGSDLEQNDYYFNTDEVAFKWYNKADGTWYKVSFEAVFEKVFNTWKTSVADDAYVDKTKKITLETILKESLTAGEVAELPNEWMDGNVIRELSEFFLREIEGVETRSLVEFTDNVKFFKEKTGVDSSGNDVFADSVVFDDATNGLLVNKVGAELKSKSGAFGGDLVNLTSHVNLRPILDQPGSLLEVRFTRLGDTARLSFPQSRVTIAGKITSQPIQFEFYENGAAKGSDAGIKIETFRKLDATTQVYTKWVRVSAFPGTDADVRNAILPGVDTTASHWNIGVSPFEVPYADLFREVDGVESNTYVQYEAEAAENVVSGFDLLTLIIKSSAEGIANRFVPAMLDFKKEIDNKLKGDQAEINTIWNAISQSSADVIIKYDEEPADPTSDDVKLGYYLSVNGQDFKYSEIAAKVDTTRKIFTAGDWPATGNPNGVLDVWGRIKNKNNKYVIKLFNKNDVLKYRYHGGYEITLTATDNNATFSFLYNALFNKVFIAATKGTITDNKGHTNLPFIQLDIAPDTISTSAGKASFQFTLVTTPPVTTKISEIDLVTSDTKLLDIFKGAFQYIGIARTATDKKIQDQEDKIKDIKNEFSTWNFGAMTDAFGNALWKYNAFPQVIAMVGKKAPDVGDKFLWDITYDPNIASKGSIMLTSVADGSVIEPVYPEDRANSDINDPSNVGKPVVGKAIADLIETNWLILEKKLDNNNKIYWKWVGLKRKPADPRPMRIESKQVNSWDELIALKDSIVSVTAFAKAQIDWYGAAFRQSNMIPFQPLFDQGWGLQGMVDLSNNTEYKMTINNASGIAVFNGTTSVGGSARIGFDKFNWYVQHMVGEGYVSTDTMLEDLAKGKPNGNYVINIVDGVLTLVKETQNAGGGVTKRNVK